MELSITVWKNIVAYLLEKDPDEEIEISWEAINATEKRVALDVDPTADGVRLSTVDIDNDATDIAGEGKTP